MLSEIEQNFRKILLDTNNQELLDLYTLFCESNPELKLEVTKYARIFGLCRLLKIKNLYDIGCGRRNQAFFLAGYPDMAYTGIDCTYDYTYINELFAKSCGERIQFQYAKYPYPIAPVSENIAIACQWGYSKRIYEAFSRDFERIIIDISSNEKISLLKKSLKDFTLTKLTGFSWNMSPIVFGTKFPKEIDMLRKINYSYCDDRFAIPFVDSYEW